MNGRHAVVIGGSMAGLLAARALADRFEQVTLIERDELPSGPAPRKGVPQSRQTHGLLAGGRELLDQLFPGMTADLIREGAVPGDMLADSWWFLEGGWLARERSGLGGLLMSRPLLEHAVRRRVQVLSNLSTRQGNVDALMHRGGCVTGVQVDGQALPADLVVDATGRGSRTPQWLDAWGYERPVEERVTVGIKYTTRLFRRSDGLGEPVAVIVPPTPDGKAGGVMLAQEGGRWTVTMVSSFGAAPPTDLAGFLDFARRLPSPAIYSHIQEAEPIGDAQTYSFPASVRTRYERLARFPERLLVIGDALCSFNPIYGQGMTVAAFEALALDKAVASGLDGLPRRFFAAAAAVVDVPWQLAVGGDLRIPEVVGARTRMGSILGWYIARLHEAAHTDARLALAFMRVANLVRPPQTLLSPGALVRVAYRHLLNCLTRHSKAPRTSAGRQSARAGRALAR